ncbi:MAG: hypothetical protein H0W25_12170 [Acidimicrobiia bacterium]|nr:hypothetical protein [Acidimicrobiia bacterium]
MKDDPRHQESFEVHALDPATGAGFVCATGRFADRMVTWAAVTTGGGDYVEHSGDGPDEGRVTFADGVLRITAHGAMAEVTVADLHPETPWRVAVDDLAHGHVETSCLVSGVVQVGERQVLLDGALGHRDRSWGPRDLARCANHRWLAGTCGPALCFSLDNLVLADGEALALGYVVRHGEVDPVRDVEIVVALAPDCLTPRSVVATAVCDSGADLTVSTTCVHQTFLDVRQGWFTATDTLFEVTADGMAGIADLNLTVNPQQGRTPPVLVQRQPRPSR